MASQAEVFHGPFSSLPVELRQAILCELPDVPALQAALEADASLKDAFFDAESLILESITCHQIPVALHPEAFAVLASSHFGDKTFSADHAQKIVNNYLLRVPSYPIKWTLDEARSLNDIHEHISCFAEEFASSALRVYPVPPKSPKPVSITERSRFMGAFYRFEFYCNLFREYPKQGDPFVSRFAPWENEQLASIYDYLFDRITPGTLAFHDITEHDIEWGELPVPFGDVSEYEPRLNYILSMGLAFLRQVIAASTYEARHRLLADIHDSHYFFLPDAFQEWCNSTRVHYHSTLYEYNEDMKRELIDHPVLTDPDGGPRQMWSYIHTFKYGREFIFCPSHRRLRLGGYVMWDVVRLLVELGLGYLQVSQLENDVPDDPIIPKYSQAEIQYSYDRRAEIWLKGGSGWWSKDDESKIVWPTGNPAENDNV
ncbi:hypothetical protein FQN55_000127 [Onygenales sp. PD_40]|nr:hypothetical protein FQN55_000127 [Onygenales sp. PD_40]